MQMAQKLFRGWMVISIIQCIGLLIQNLRDPTLLLKALIASVAIHAETAQALSRAFCVIIVQQMCVKLALLLSTQIKYLIILDVVYCVLSAAYYIATATTPYSLFVQTQWIFAVVSVVFDLTFVFLEWKNAGRDDDETKRRPRKLIAKHYLESHVSDFNKAKDKSS